jgi:hypothetical protein
MFYICFFQGAADAVLLKSYGVTLFKDAAVFGQNVISNNAPGE